MVICFIIPPHILEEVTRKGTPLEKEWAKRSLQESKRIRQQRTAFAIERPKSNPLLKGEEFNGEIKNRIIYSADNSTLLPGKKIGSETLPPKDISGKEAYDGTGATWDLYWEIYKRNSIDNKGLNLVSTVHYGQLYDNAFWDGEQMVYGDGDGQLFTLFTKPIDVTGHELTHGVTQYTANLEYQNQSGALNESFSDVFGTLVKQKSLHQTVEQADWLIGQGIFTSKVHGVALRSMKAPGTAYDDPVLGRDPQPADMNHFVTSLDDNGGVHVNSGIPNHAFYLAASGIGGYAWEKSGNIWYDTLTKKLQKDATFVDCANATIQSAKELCGNAEVKAVTQAWKTVGVL